MRRIVMVVALATMLVSAFPTPGNAVVRIKGVSAGSGFVWSPRNTTVTSGTRVVWKAMQGTHTVTAYRGPWSKDATIAPGERTAFRFRKAGVYRFRCIFHSSLVGGRCRGMCGKVVVG